MVLDGSGVLLGRVLFLGLSSLEFCPMSTNDINVDTADDAYRVEPSLERAEPWP